MSFSDVINANVIITLLALLVIGIATFGGRRPSKKSSNSEKS